VCGSYSAFANHPRRDQLGLGVQGRPSPDVSRFASSHHFRRGILVFGVYKGPNLIALDTLAGEVSQRLVLICRTGRADIDQQLGHRVDAAIRQATGGAKTVAFDQ